MRIPNSRKQGSALVESCLVMALLCLILFGILQVVQVVAARNVINYSAVATARAATVGLNDFMLFKVSRYATIPTAGPAVTPPGFERVRPEGESAGSLFMNSFSRQNATRSPLGTYEIGVKKSYHMAGLASHDLILDYENWQHEESKVQGSYFRDGDGLIHLTIEQYVPLSLPFSKLFFPRAKEVKAKRDGDLYFYPAADISASVVIEDHAALYLKSAEERMETEF